MVKALKEVWNEDPFGFLIMIPVVVGTWTIAAGFIAVTFREFVQ